MEIVTDINKLMGSYSKLKLLCTSIIKRDSNNTFYKSKTFQLAQQRIFIPLLSLITFNYRNYKNVDGKSVPSEVLISYMKGSKITTINLEYSQFDFPENLNFSMEIPSDYNHKFR